MEIQLRSDRNQNGIMIDSCKICQGALLGLFLFYSAFRLHSLILRLDALFSFIKAHPNTNQSWLGGVLGKHTPTSTRAHPNRYQSTSWECAFGVCWGVLWCLSGRAFQSVLWSSRSVLWRCLGCALLRVGPPKKYQKLCKSYFPRKGKKHWFL